MEHMYIYGGIVQNRITHAAEAVTGFVFDISEEAAEKRITKNIAKEHPSSEGWVKAQFAIQLVPLETLLKITGGLIHNARSA